MSDAAVTALPAIASTNGWQVNTAEPDMFGDVRATAERGGSTVRLVFDPTGSLQGGYLYADGGTWHTTRRTDVKRWLIEGGGA